MPKPYRGSACQLEKWTNGSGTGRLLIQNSGQAALGQIESELIAIIRQEAEARGMNLVLHREQVALNIQAFDITDDVSAQLNKLLPSVQVPPSIVTPGMVVNPPQQDQNGGGNGQ